LEPSKLLVPKNQPITVNIKAIVSSIIPLELENNRKSNPAIKNVIGKIPCQFNGKELLVMLCSPKNIYNAAIAMITIPPKRFKDLITYLVNNCNNH
jgi:hypothetical protein